MKKLEANENLISMEEDRDMRNSVYTQLAKDIRSYFNSLINQGFNEKQALALVLNYQTFLLGLSIQNNK
jgi:hypothetical protein